MLGNVKILRDLVVVEPITQKKKAAGYAMPEEVAGTSGKVIAIGPKVEGILIGTIVHFGNVCKPYVIKGQNCVVMEQDNVVGIEEAE